MAKAAGKPKRTPTAVAAADGQKVAQKLSKVIAHA
jgi:hypothetical protein